MGFQKQDKNRKKIKQEKNNHCNNSHEKQTQNNITYRNMQKIQQNNKKGE